MTRSGSAGCCTTTPGFLRARPSPATLAIRWDRYLKSNSSALTADEKAGFQTFSKAGRPSCHAGLLVGGNIFQKLGIANPWPGDTDLSVFTVTKREADKRVFKAPSLRNVERTAPYFHNGKAPTLEDAVRKMGHYQLGTELIEHEVRGIVTWLRCLTGEVPHDHIRQPELPVSTAATPKPDLT
jgi:cytochrome c peroxidase